MKKLISALCAAALAVAMSVPTFAASGTAPVTQEPPLHYADKNIKTLPYEQGRLQYEIPEDWTLENLENGAKFTSEAHQIFILYTNLEQAIADKDKAYAFMDDLLDRSFVKNPGFKDVEVLRRENIVFLSSYAISSDIKINQSGTDIKFKITAFMSPDLKSYATVFMPVASLAAEGDLGKQMDVVTNKVSDEYYEMLLNSMKWATPTSSTVYWAPGGKSYHSTPDCVSLKRSKAINSGALQDAITAGKFDPCNLCVK